MDPDIDHYRPFLGDNHTNSSSTATTEPPPVEAASYFAMAAT